MSQHDVNVVRRGFTLQKGFVFGAFLVRIFTYSDWIRRDTEYLPVFSPILENTSQNNSEYGHFLLESEEKRTSDDYILTQKQFSVQTSEKQIQNTRSKHWPNLKTQLGHYKWFKEWQKHRGTGQKGICGNAIKISS